MNTLAYDKAADDLKVHQKLHAAGIRPLIQNRSLWKQETEQMLPSHDGNSNIVYDEACTLHCYDRVSQPMVRHPMVHRTRIEPRHAQVSLSRQARELGLSHVLSL